MLRGDPVIISPVQVFGAEYLHDIGWSGRPVLDMFPAGHRRYWRFFEISSVLGTMGLAFLEVYLLLNQAFLDVGVAAIVVWTTWLGGNRIFWMRSLAQMTSGLH